MINKRKIGTTLCVCEMQLIQSHFGLSNIHQILKEFLFQQCIRKKIGG